MDLKDHIEYSQGALIKSSGVGAAVAPTKFNPEFVSQFDLAIKTYFYIYTYSGTVNGENFYLGNISSIAPSVSQWRDSILAFFLFGNSDFSGGYQNAAELLPIQIGDYVKNVLVSGDANYTFYHILPVGVRGVITLPLQSVQDGFAKRGDIVQLYVFLEPNGTNNLNVYTAEIVISCKQVAYGTLLDSVGSDRFKMNNIRYKVPSGNTVQFENPLKLIRQSLFGKLSTDEITPAAYQLPNNFQTNIIDIPLIKGIDKETSICSYLDPLTPEILLSVFVETQRKITEKVK